MIKSYFRTLTVLLLLLIGFTFATTVSFFVEEPVLVVFCGVGVLIVLFFLFRLYKGNARKIAFMFDAIDNDDYAFKFADTTLSESDKLVNLTLNRVKGLLVKAKVEAIEKEKYYEIILNCVSTGVLVVDDRGNVVQTNNEALRLLGLPILTHLTQLKNIDEHLSSFFSAIQPGEKTQTTFANERGNVHLAVRVSGMNIRDEHLRVMALNDINKELDEKEIDSWIRLIRVLTHEIMNSITPITSLSDTMLELHGEKNPDIRQGLEVISTTGKSLISFVESYRRFTRIPTPEPTLFYVEKFVDRMVELARHQEHYPNITVKTDVRPADLIVYADEKLITQVMLNLLKNAMQAIGTRTDGRIQVKGYCNQEEEVVIEVTNNGPPIPPEVADHIFIPFFTTKDGGSGIGLSVSKQIMRLSGGTITLNTSAATGLTTFMLTFK